MASAVASALIRLATKRIDAKVCGYGCQLNWGSRMAKAGDKRCIMATAIATVDDAAPWAVWIDLALKIRREPGAIEGMKSW